MKKILFGLNTSADKKLENAILDTYVEEIGREFTYDSEYYLQGIITKLSNKEYNLLILKEDLEGIANPVTIEYLDRITDKYPQLRVILIIEDEHEKDNYVKMLFNLGIYDVLYKEDSTIQAIVQLIEEPRSKMQSKIYLDLDEIENIPEQDNLQEIQEEEYKQILSYLSKVGHDKLSESFDEIYRQYNEKQMLFLFTLLPSEIINKLSETGNENFEQLHKKWVRIETKYNQIDYEQELDKATPNDSTKKLEDNNENKHKHVSTQVIYKEKMLNACVIGIGTAQRGAGSTYHSLSIAHYLSSLGCKVAIIGITESAGLKDIDTSALKINVDIFTFSDKGLNAAQEKIIALCNEQKYNYIVCDFGVVFEHEYFNEYLRANFKILISFGDIWHQKSIDKLTYIPNIQTETFPLMINFSNINNIEKKAKYVYPSEYNDDIFRLTEKQKELYNKMLQPILPRETKPKRNKFFSFKKD